MGSALWLETTECKMYEICLKTVHFCQYSIKPELCSGFTCTQPIWRAGRACVHLLAKGCADTHLTTSHNSSGHSRVSNCAAWCIFITYH